MKQLLLIICTVLTLACGGGSGSSAPTAPSPAPAPAPSPPAASDLAPAALQGTWTTVLQGSSQLVTLVLNDRTYRITRGSDGAAGSIAVRGDQIEFSNSNACNGTGPYRWSITGSSLQLVGNPIGSDPCSGRAEVLDGYTYTKS